MSKWTIPPEGGHMDKPSGIYFQTMTKKDVEERLKKNDILIVPVGSTENHGAAGPFGEDTFVVTRMAEEIAKATGCTEYGLSQADLDQPARAGVYHPFGSAGVR